MNNSIPNKALPFKGATLAYKAIGRDLIIIASLAFLTACGGAETSVPKQYVQFDTMVLIMTDMQVLEAKANLARTGSMIEDDKAAIKTDYEQIFYNYNTSQARFDSSYNYYARHPELLDKVFEKAVEELNRKNTEAMK